MAVNDFSNQNIQDTYQRVVQTDGTNRLADGTGSVFIPVSSSHAITASHALFAVSASHEITFELSSSHAQTASFISNGIHELTSAEVNQLKNINTNTISEVQFGFVGSMNQSVASNVGPTFTSITLGGITGADVKLPTGATAANPHISVRFDGDVPSIFLGDNGGDIITFVNQEGTAVARISQEGMFTGTVTNGARTNANNIFSVDQTLNNNIDILGKETGGTARHLLSMSPQNVVRVGATSQPLSVRSSGNIHVTGSIISANDISLTSITSSGIITAVNISASGTIHALNMKINNQRLIVDNDNLTLPDTGLAVTGPITASGEISASGNIISQKYKFSEDEGNKYLQATGTSDLTVKFSNSEFVGSISASGNISASSFITDGNITASGNISASGTVFASALDLEGANLTYNATHDILKFGDNVKLGIGAGPVAQTGDLTISSDGTDSSISATIGNVTLTNTSGNTIIRNQGISKDIILQTDKNPGGQQGGQVLISGSNADVRLQVLGNITASGNISASGNVETQKIGVPGFHFIDFGPAAGTGGFIKLSSDDTEIMRLDGDSGKVGIGTTSPGEKLEVVGNISASGTVNASHITASGNVQANHYYGYQLSVHPSNFTVALNGSYYYLPLTGQSTAEHATSNSNERIPLVNSFNGHAIKTSIRSTNNAALNGAKITCSIFFEPPYNNGDFANNAPGSVNPGDTNDGHILWAEAHATGTSQNHNAVHIDWRNPFSGSFVANSNDIPSGSRVYLTMKSDHASSVAYVVSTTFAWDYSSL